MNSLPASGGNIGCGINGLLSSSIGICTGPNAAFPFYPILGPTSIPGTASLVGATSVSGITTFLNFVGSRFLLDSSYTLGTPIVSSATFAGQTLAGLGLPANTTLGTWTIDTETIQVVTTSAASTPVNSVPFEFNEDLAVLTFLGIVGMGKAIEKWKQKKKKDSDSVN